jgi:DNA (cytosine-5)-methyltransferase 3A
MNILSLFDGISCARVALERAGIIVDKYYSCEIDKYAQQIAFKNYPDTIQLGDVKNIRNNSEFVATEKIDLLIGGSPCQDLSIAKNNREGLKGSRSGLFWEYVRILKAVKPKYFVLENVASMSKEAKETITKALGVEPIMINAVLVSAQNRKRLFWVGKLVGDKYKQVEISQPEDRGIILKDILENGISAEYSRKYGIKNYGKEKSQTINASDWRGINRNQTQTCVVDEKSYCLPATYYKENVKSLFKREKTGLTVRVGKLNEKGGQGDRVYSPIGKSVTLSANGGGRGAKTGLYETEKGFARKLTAVECERLQCLPDNFSAGISNTQRLKCLGNAFNVEVVAHILKNLKK